IRLVLMRLTAEGVTRLLVEGGPTTARAFVSAGVADEILVMQGEARLAPDASLLPFGADGLELISSSKSFILAGQRMAGSDTVRIFRSAAHWQGCPHMFTGLVQAKGIVEAAINGRFTIACPWEPASIALGASICCDGCCLTATAVEPAPGGARFKLDVSDETL